MRTLLELYSELLKHYGPQGWWPLTDVTSLLPCYHPNDYSYPQNDLQRWEIIMGTLLTQNTTWTSVEKAITNLFSASVHTPQKISTLTLSSLEEHVRPAGYFRQKAQRLQELARWFLQQKDVPSRKELLSLKGIGPETADSILLYAYKLPFFVVDAYTKRILFTHGYILETASYDEVQLLFHKGLSADVALFQEFHALLVAHAKKYYSRKPYGEQDFLL